MADPNDVDLRMDAAALYREDLFSDQRVGTIRQMTPVTRDGTPDASRETIFIGQTQIMTNAGMLPITFEIPARTLGEAADGYGEAAKKALQETVAELQEMRRQAASGLVIPDAGTTSAILGPGGGPAAGAPGGKIRLR